MKKELKELLKGYSKRKDIETHASVKCLARIRTCPECETRYEKDATKCKKCGKTRPTCNNWALPGNTVCRMHGGKGGRPLTKGVNMGKNTFTKKEWDEIEGDMKAKKRDHEFVYQVATKAFRKITENLDPEDEDTPIKVLAAAGEYFSKISKYMTDIDVKEAEMVHFYSFGQIQDKQVHRTLKVAIEKTKESVLFLVMGVLRTTISAEQYDKFYQILPKQYLDVLARLDKQRALGDGND